MRYPVNKVYITQKWGVNPNTYSRFGFKGHNGIDLRLHEGIGTPIFAPHDGVVKERRFDADGYGNYLKIENDEEGSILGHLDRFTVNVNKQVKEGDLIGYGGNTGWSTGPHLHWGYYRFPRNRLNGYGGTINQIPYITNSESDDMSDQYKGLDLTNKESMKVAVDIWADVRDGKYIQRDECEKRVSEVETKLNRSVGQYKSKLDKIKPVFDKFNNVVQAEVVDESDVEPAINAYCDTKQQKDTDEDVDDVKKNAVTDGGKEVGRIALLAVYATPISMFLLPVINSLLTQFGLDVQLELVHLVPIITTILKAVDRSIHNYGKLVDSEQLTKSIARF